MLIYCWIEKYRNIERKGILLNDNFNIIVKNIEHEDLKYRNRYERIIPKPCYKREVEIAINNTNFSLKNVNVLLGKNATGKSNILDCLVYRGEERYCFWIFYDQNNKSVYIKSFGIELDIQSDLKFNLHIDKDPFHNTNNIFEYNIMNRSIDGVYYTPNKAIDINHGHHLSYELLIPVNPFKNEIKDYFVSLFETILMYKDKLIEKYDNDIGKMVIILPQEEKERSEDLYFNYPKSYFGKEKDKPYDYQKAKISFICRLFDLIRKKFEKFLDDYNSHNTTIGDKEQGLDKQKWEKEYIPLLKKLYANIPNFYIPKRRQQSLTSFAIFDYTCLTTALDDFLKDFFTRDEFSSGLPIEQQKFIPTLEVFFKKLFDLDEKCFTAFFKLELEFSNENLEVVECVDELLQVNSYIKLDDIVFTIEWWSSGQEQFIRWLSLLKRDFTWRTNRQAVLPHNDYIIIIDEPEAHIDMVSQKNFLDDLIEAFNTVAGRNTPFLQIIIATHSQFIMKNAIDNQHVYELTTNHLSLDNNHKVIIRPVESKIGVSTPMSYGQILYDFFDIISVDFHIELYNKLASLTQSGGRLYNATTMNNKNEYERIDLLTDPQKSEKYKDGKTGRVYYTSLSTFVRHQIHHGDNQYIGSSDCRKINDSDIRNSIRIMRSKV